MHPILNRRHAVLGLALAAAFAGTTAFAKDDDSYREGKLLISTNATGGNVLQVYDRNDAGPATLLSSLPTNGTGTGAGLGSQAAIALSTSGSYLFVVNAGSNSVSTFKINGKGLTLTSTVASGGTRPIGVAESDGLVYVLNAPNGGTGAGNTLAGFRNVGGVLTPLANGVRALADNSAPAQVSFDSDGDVPIVSEKAATQLVSYKVGKDGTLSTSYGVNPSPGSTPFGFGVTKKNIVVVSEAGTSSASSYKVGEKTEPLLQLVSPAVADGQGAACWISVTPDGKFAYAANAAASNISSYSIDNKGRLTLLAAQAGFTSNNGALDMAVTPDGKQLHVLASRAPQQIVSFTISGNGSLTKIGAVGAVIPGSAGLVAN